jgi:putative PIN family toxin of toxin-antitoxin system
LDELKEILVRPDKPFKLTEEEADRVVKAMQNVAEVVETQSQVMVCRDEKDNKVLECAVDGRAEWIITGDAHLLELQSFKKVRIVTVAEFLRRF